MIEGWFAWAIVIGSALVLVICTTRHAIKEEA